jgi:hypothetical protein
MSEAHVFFSVLYFQDVQSSIYYLTETKQKNPEIQQLGHPKFELGEGYLIA